MSKVNILASTTKICQTAVSSVAKDLPLKVTPLVAVCNNARMGHYQCNNAMQLFKLLQSNKDTKGIYKSPVQVGQKIAEQISKYSDPNMISNVETAGPGFVNITLTSNYISKCVLDLLQSNARLHYDGDIQKVVVDFSSPNIAKEMHVGHLRSTIIGDSICRILEYRGHKVLRVNHVGDWGAPFGMMIAYWKELQSSSSLSIDLDLEELHGLYQQSRKRFDTDDEFKKKARDELVKLQSKDADSMKVWHELCNTSRKAFQIIYDKLNINITEVGESFYDPILPIIADELTKNNTAVIANGALCIFVPKYSNPLIVRKTNGGYTYDTTDLAAVWHRINKERANRMIYVTDVGQERHFNMVFDVARSVKWANEAHMMEHVGFGLVFGEDGKKLKTRSGSSVKLIELINEGHDRCLKLLEERDDDNIEDKSVLAHYISIAAMKYADLSQSRLSDYTFSFDKMLDTKGKTGVYVLYTFARISSIISKSNNNMNNDNNITKLSLDDPYELSLALDITKFPEVLNRVETSWELHILCDYVHDLCTSFSRFYQNCSVLNAAEESRTERLVLCKATLIVLHRCLDLLGITPVERL